jgi:tetratricopeptide (TPR) repeat protein
MAMKRTVSELEVVLASETDPLQRYHALMALNDQIGKGEFLRSSAICLEAVELAERLGNDSLQAAAHVKLSTVLWKLGELEKSQMHAQKGLEISKKTGDKLLVSEAYGSLGIVHGILEDHANALDYFEKAAKVAEEIGNDIIVAHMLGNMGNVYRGMTEYITALKYFAKALAIDRELGEDGLPGVSNMLEAIAGVMVFQGEYEGAVKKIEEAILIDEKTGNLRGKVVALHNLGITYHKWGRHAEAITYLVRSLALADSIHFHVQKPETHLSLSKVYEAVGEVEDAIHHLRKYQEFQKEAKRTRLNLAAVPVE